MPKHDITVKLTSQDGNAFAIMGAVQRALRKAGASKDEIAAYTKAAMAGDYNNLLRVTMETVNVE